MSYMNIQGQRICIIVPSSEARGTRRIVDDYRSYFEKIGAVVELKRPPQAWPKWRVLAWELLALYLGSCKREDVLLSPNGRISPRVFLGVKRVYMLVLLDTMNIGFRKLVDSEFRLTEKLNILINSVLMPPSIIGSTYLTAISKKTAADFETYLKRRNPRYRSCDKGLKGIVLYPGGSFKGSALDSGEIYDAERPGIERAIWISGETRNKGFIEGMGLLEEYATEFGITDAYIYGIRSARLKESAERLMIGRECRLVFEAVNSREEKLIQCYLESRISLCLSKSEGYGIPFLDSLMMGIPVIATKIDTYLEIVKMVSELIDTIPPILWFEHREKGTPRLDKARVHRFRSERSSYCLPSKAERIKRYKEIDGQITSSSADTLAKYLSRLEII